MAKKISVITPAIRRAELDLSLESLSKQTFPRKDFEWIVCSPFEFSHANIWVKDPPRNPGDFMGENKAYNELFQRVSGELVVTLNDSLYLQPTALYKLWDYYQKDKMSCVCLVGNHYQRVTKGTGWNLTYRDVRRDQMHSSFEPTTLTNFDACVSSIPAKAVKQVGKIDPMWDKYCCFGIREFMLDVMQLGYKLYISSETEFIGQKHAKTYDPNNQWEEKFREGGNLWRERHPNAVL